MAEQTFKSPGYFEREIDLSQRKPVKSNAVPGGIIGIAETGPAFVPITVSSITQFKEVFGKIKPEYYGAIAANEFLKNTPNVTFVRTLGAGVIQTSAQLANFKKFGTVPSAGFQLSGSQPTAAIGASKTGETRGVGCIQFIAGVHTIQTNEQYGSTAYSKNDTLNESEPNLIRGAVLMASGARLEILSHNENYPAGSTADDQALISSYDGSKTQGTFKLVISSSMGSTFSNDEKKGGIKIYTASLDPDSEYYFGKVLNTSEDQFHSKQHLLYTDYPVEKDLVQHKYDASNATVAVISGSAGISGDGDTSKNFQEVFGAFNTRYRNARTTTFISQPFGDTEYDLFHFETIADGANSNLYYSVSISNIKKSLTAKDSYGSFTVELRSYNNDDLSLNVIEQFPNCTLNPDDPNFIGRLIGDSKLKYNFDTLIEKERGLINEGTYENKSKNIRVVIKDAVIDKKIPPSCLPFGYRGFPVLKTTDTLSNGSTAIGDGGSGKRLANLGTVSTFDYAVIPPLPFTYKVTRGNVNTSPSFPGDPSQDEITDSRIYWGIQAGRLAQNVTVNANGGLGNPELLPNVRVSNLPSLIDSYSKFLGIEGLDAVVTGSGADSFHNHKFTLAKIAINPQSDTTQNIASALSTELTASITDHMKEAAYIRNGVLKQPNYTIDDGTLSNRLTFATLAAGKPATFNKFSEFMKFTNVFYGGFDGLNILDKDSRLMTDKGSSLDAGGKAAGGTISYQNLKAASSPGVGLNNNIVASYIQAAKAITLDGATNINMLAVPGIREKIITNKVSDLVKENSKIIYLMDIPSFDVDNNRLYIDSTTIPSVEKTIDNFQSRGIDNNYVATYFPDVFLDSDQFVERVKVPASVSAMQALSYNDKVAYPWFAPAGFARGVLDNVATTALRLTSADRDGLYEARINPIANFSTGKIVIFGQKTLQADKSALDRVNVRRMVLKVKRIVSNIAKDFLFEQNTPQTRAKFVARVTPQLGLVQSQQGIDKFRVVMDETNNTSLDEEQNRLNGSIVLVPSRAIEFIAIDFIVTNAGVSF